MDRSDNGTVFVIITSQSACGSCKAREACGLAEAKDKIVEVKSAAWADYAPGDSVTVGVHQRAGTIAVLLAYVGALVVLVGVLVVAIKALGMSEGRGALAGIVGVVAYYGMLWVFRNKIEHTIQFTINKN